MSLPRKLTLLRVQEGAGLMGGGEECGEEDGLIGVRSAGRGILALTVGCELHQSLFADRLL